MSRHTTRLLVVVAGLSVARAAPVEIHPAGSTIAENLLRIELRFAQPQRLPFDIQRVKLIDARGEEVEGALLDLALPSADGRRVTVLMDPGPVKSGVGPNLDTGRALRAGDVVSLRIDDDAVGRSPLVKTWRVTAAVSHSIEAVAWRLTDPRAGSRDPLIVDLREPISSSGEGLIAVLDPAAVPCVEQRPSAQPTQPTQSGASLRLDRGRRGAILWSPTPSLKIPPETGPAPPSNSCEAARFAATSARQSSSCRSALVGLIWHSYIHCRSESTWVRHVSHPG